MHSPSGHSSRTCRSHSRGFWQIRNAVLRRGPQQSLTHRLARLSRSSSPYPLGPFLSVKSCNKLVRFSRTPVIGHPFGESRSSGSIPPMHRLNDEYQTWPMLQVMKLAERSVHSGSLKLMIFDTEWDAGFKMRLGKGRYQKGLAPVPTREAKPTARNAESG